MRRMKKWLTIFLCICLMLMTVPENAFINWQNVKAADYDGDGEDGEEWDDFDDGNYDDADSDDEDPGDADDDDSDDGDSDDENNDDSDASDDDNSGKDTPVLPVTTPQPDHATEVPQGYVAIYDIEGLNAVRNGLGQNYILMSDIDMTTATAPGGEYDDGNGWKPIEDFTGNFDGNGYRIIGMHIFGDMKENNAGLFGSASGDIKNLGMKNCDIDVSNVYYLGGIVGYHSGSMSQCYTSGKIQVKAEKSEWGDDVVRYSYGYIGGLMGGLEASEPYDDEDEASYSIVDCYNAADIKVDMSEISSVDPVEVDSACGGIIGLVQTGKYSSHYQNCIRCYNYGDVVDGKGYGICGKDDSGYGDLLRYQNCFYLAKSAQQGCQRYEDGYKNEDIYKIDITKIAQESQMKKKSYFTNFDFDNTWEIDSFCTEYPYPQLRHNRQVRATSVVLKKLPSKLIYMQGDPAAFSDGEITITYENGSTTEINMDESMLSGYDLNKIGKQTVILSFAGFQTQFSIEVKGVAVTGITLDQTELTLGVSESKMLMAAVLPANATNKNIIWESSDEKIVTVSSDGTVQAKKKGEATITAYSFDKKKSASCKVTVNVPCVKLTFGEYDSEMYPGETQKIRVSMQPLETQDSLTWMSGNQNIATVDEEGNVTAVAAGKVDITVTADSGVSEKCTILVRGTGNAAETPAPNATGTSVPDASKTSAPDATPAPAESTGNPPENELQQQADQVSVKISSVTKAKKTSAVLKFKGSNTSQADGYQIKVKQKGKKAYVKTIDVCKSYKLKGLKKKKKYTVKVRAYVYNEDDDNTYYGSWSSEKSFRTR